MDAVSDPPTPSAVHRRKRRPTDASDDPPTQATTHRRKRRPTDASDDPPTQATIQGHIRHTGRQDSTTAAFLFGI